MANLQQLFDYYLQNQSDLVQQYNGKYLIIKDNAVAGAFDTKDDALVEGKTKYGMGNFLLQLCTAGKDAYTFVFHSRVRMPHAN